MIKSLTLWYYSCKLGSGMCDLCLVFFLLETEKKIAFFFRVLDYFVSRLLNIFQAVQV
jgi:hypothetical protein